VISQSALSLPRPAEDERPALQFLQDPPAVVHLPTAQLEQVEAEEPEAMDLPAGHDEQEFLLSAV
jgi:hypothetical protein